MQRFNWLIVFTTLILSPLPSFSDAAFTQRKEVRLFIQDMVKEYHFNSQQLTQTMSQIQLQPQIIASMEKPYEKKNWDVYKNLFLTTQRIQRGLDYWNANKTILEKAQQQYGVPPEIIVAILGVETLYGERQGEYRVLDALGTLAFNYPKRSEFFRKELREYLLLCREHGVLPTQYKGSYAGAIGQPQFMPSSYRYYAVDFNKTGKPDLISNNSDSISSVANYFHKHGWKSNQGIAQQAQWTRWKLKSLQTNPKTANYPFSQLEKAGVKAVTTNYSHPNRAALIELLTNQGKEYWLAYPNFFVITRYNSSPQYALVVYLLSQQLKEEWLALQARKPKAYA